MRLQGNNMRKLTPKMGGEREEENKGMRKQRLANTLASLGAASKEGGQERGYIVTAKKTTLKEEEELEETRLKRKREAFKEWTLKGKREWECKGCEEGDAWKG